MRRYVSTCSLGAWTRVGGWRRAGSGRVWCVCPLMWMWMWMYACRGVHGTVSPKSTRAQSVWKRRRKRSVLRFVWAIGTPDQWRRIVAGYAWASRGRRQQRSGHCPLKSCHELGLVGTVRSRQGSKLGRASGDDFALFLTSNAPQPAWLLSEPSAVAAPPGDQSRAVENAGREIRTAETG